MAAVRLEERHSRPGFPWSTLAISVLTITTILAVLNSPTAAKIEESRLQEPVKPIRALLITGGCCHDYETQKLIITEGTAARAPIDWVVRHQGGSTTNTKIPVYENEDWAKGFDVVVHNECFADVADPKWTERILKPHRENGIPAVVIHCAMHCYRDKTDEWFKFVGVTSHQHGAHYGLEVMNLASNDSIMEGFPNAWKTREGELYQIARMGENCKPLAHALSRETKKHEPCIWTNQYGKARVFGTTLGHYNSEMADPVFLNFLTRGILWSCDKLHNRYLKPFDPTKTKFRWETSAPRESKEPPVLQDTPGKLVPENLARGKKASASSEQDEDRSASKAVDGRLDTRWCANGPESNAWWMVDLGKAEDVAGCRIVWEFDGKPYQYRIEGSSSGEKWLTLVDQTREGLDKQVQNHQFAAPGTRFVRITITGLQEGCWPSFFEVQVHGKKMVKPDAAPLTLPSSQTTLAGVRVPAEFEATLFAAPPDISYPTCVAATPDGVVFVGVDLNGSLGKNANKGKVIRCMDSTGSGKADKFNVFTEVESPRGLWYDHNTLYVLHPPCLTAFHDDNGDGVADRKEVLLRGLECQDLRTRGADHCTNGFRMGIDGFFYIAVGDFGAVKAVAKDGTSLQFYGGGVLRIRPDGTGMEIVARGLRNIYDVAVSPQLDLFTRDNTNDGDGWDVRLSHIIPSAHYGYPTRFVNFADEIIQPLADYGGGAPCGSLYLDEPGFPAGFGSTLYTCDWGRSMVYRHPLEVNGASFKADQKEFVRIPRPTDIDVDGSGHLYISSWKDGGFDFSKPDVGYVIRVTPRGTQPTVFPDLARTQEANLVAMLASPGAVARLAAQREILHRGGKLAAGLVLVDQLEKLASSHESSAVRAAAVFTLKQLLGSRATPILLRLADLENVREYALHALTDNRKELDDVPAQPFLKALKDPNPRVRLQAAIGLGRLQKPEVAPGLLPLTADTDPVVAHCAVSALVALKASDFCLQSLDHSEDKTLPGIFRVLQSLQDPGVVKGLMDRLDRTRDPKVRRGILISLARLYQREGEWDGKWWGTRPDTRGPYFKPVTWEESSRISEVLHRTLENADGETLRWFLPELIRHRIDWPEITDQVLKLAASDRAFRYRAVNLLADRGNAPGTVELFRTVAMDSQADESQRQKALRSLLRRVDQMPARQALIDGLTASEKLPPSFETIWNEFARDGRNMSQLASFVKLAAMESPSHRELGFGVLANLALNPGTPEAMRAEANAVLENAWKNRATAVPLLRAIARLNLPAYGPTIRRLTASPDAEIATAAKITSRALQLDRTGTGPAIEKMKYDDILTQAVKDPGNAVLGASLFSRQKCNSCHTVSSNETPRGPYLGGIRSKYSRAELVESILKPSAKISQGFESQVFTLTSGKSVTGFVVRESGTEVEVRDTNATVTLLKKADIDERSRSPISIMPEKLVDELTVQELASILAYLETLKK